MFWSQELLYRFLRLLITNFPIDVLTTKTGKPRYFFAREPKDQVLEQIPAGYVINESVNGIVSLSKDRPSQLQASEMAAVEVQLRKHPKHRNYRLSIKSDRIEIYELAGPDPETLIAELQGEGVMSSGMVERLQAQLDRYAQFTPVLRFILAEPEYRTFRTERMCWRSSIDDWINVEPYGPIETVAQALIPKLGTEAFFELW